MKCKCGGPMQLKLVAMDTEIHICLLCGRDNLPRRVSTESDIQDKIGARVTKSGKRPCELPRTCPGCGRGGLIFSGHCQRCRDREKRGLDLITGKPLATGAPSAALGR